MKTSTARVIQELSLRTYRALGCEGAARVDLMLDHRTHQPYVLEINTIPGMTETSLLPRAAQHAGIVFYNLVEQIMLTARVKEIQQGGGLNTAAAPQPS